MEYVLKERIGNPNLFTGRVKELSFFLKWIDDIKEEKSKSTAILARRKMGKSALMERLFNITFHKNDRIIPFYYEIKEGKVWVVDFCKDFFITFIYQYIAFKSRKAQYLVPENKSNLNKVKEIAKKEGLDYLTGIIESVQHSVAHESIDILWDTVKNAPRTLATRQNEFVVQMIDEFQFLNSEMYWDKAKTNPADTMAGGYLSTAESKVAPLLVSGSWIGWLMNELIMMLPARFKFKFLRNLPGEEALEMVFKYARFFGAPVTEETAFLISEHTEGSPFYIGSILRSNYEEKNLTTLEGLTKTLTFETLNDEGEIKSTWMEYVFRALKRVNDRNAKNIVLYLSKNRDREISRKELLETLELDMTDVELEKKLKALVKGDIIEQGSSNNRYLGVRDNIFDKVFRGVYQEEIESFEPGQIKKEYREAFEELKKKYLRLQGAYNYHKGYFAEYLLLDQLRYHGLEKNALLKSITNNLPPDFNFREYESVWSYRFATEYGRGSAIDIFARSKSPTDYSIVGEVKNRDKKKFSKDEAAAFKEKIEALKDREKLERVMGFVFSRKGFTKEAEAYCRKNGIAYTADEGWLEI
ncbi:MAG: hypothetical protein GY757_33985 [bacterium]|nr:hypothetical protein [bacterium]